MLAPDTVWFILTPQAASPKSMEVLCFALFITENASFSISLLSYISETMIKTAFCWGNKRCNEQLAVSGHSLERTQIYLYEYQSCNITRQTLSGSLSYEIFELHGATRQPHCVIDIAVVYNGSLLPFWYAFVTRSLSELCSLSSMRSVCFCLPH